MKYFYEESWFKRLGILICVLLLLLSFGIRNLLILTLPFILIGVYGFIVPIESEEKRLFIRIFSVMLMLPFLLAALAIIGGGLDGMWFDQYTKTVWAIVFNGVLIYAGAALLAGMLLWCFKDHRRHGHNQAKDIKNLPFVTLEPRMPSAQKNLPRPKAGASSKDLVIPINKKTDWVKLPCRLTNESELPVIAIGLEALNEEVTGTRSQEHALLIPPKKTAGIYLYVPVTEAKHLDIRISFTNVLGQSATGLLSLTASGGLYYGTYNLNPIETERP